MRRKATKHTAQDLPLPRHPHPQVCWGVITADEIDTHGQFAVITRVNNGPVVDSRPTGTTRDRVRTE